ncbi:hypothetical protein D3C73_1020310 [compost metagenome]
MIPVDEIFVQVDLRQRTRRLNDRMRYWLRYEIQRTFHVRVQAGRIGRTDGEGRRCCRGPANGQVTAVQAQTQTALRIWILDDGIRQPVAVRITEQLIQLREGPHKFPILRMVNHHRLAQCQRCQVLALHSGCVVRPPAMAVGC